MGRLPKVGFGYPRLLCCLKTSCGALVIESEEVVEDFLLGECSRPAISGEHSFVEGAVSVGQPFRTRVVEPGESAGFEVVFGSPGRVKPVVAEADELAGGVGDGADDGGIGFGRFRARWVREGKCIEAGCFVIGNIARNTMP